MMKDFMMMDFTIREARMDDAPSIHELNRDGMGYEYDYVMTLDKLRLLLGSDKDRILVAVFQGTVIGYIHANDYDVTYAPHMKNIMGIAVADSYRKHGVGKALLEGIETWARESGAHGVRLVSGAARTQAHEFYNRCGYGGGRQQVNFKKMLH